MHDIPADDLNALADRLRGWQPSAGGLDRDRLIYESGRAAGLAEARRSFRGRLWPMALATAASLFLAVGLFLTRGSKRSEKPELAEVPQQPRPAAVIEPLVPADPNSYLALSRRVANGSFDPARTDPALTRDSERPSRGEGPPPLRARDIDRLLNL